MRNGVALVISMLALISSNGCSSSPISSSDPSSGSTQEPALGQGGCNWADARDNFVDDALFLSGWGPSDSVDQRRAKSLAIAQAFRVQLGASWVRLPINPATVSGSGWAAYCVAIDACLSAGLKVILCCWEGRAAKNGRVDDLDRFWAQWDQVVSLWSGDARVFFEPLNEPYGYSTSEWSELAGEWLSRYQQVPHGRVLVGGTGYDDTLDSIAADSRFADCLLSLHLYAFWDSSYSRQTDSAWADLLRTKIAPGGSRVILTEFGVPLSTGIDYTTEILPTTPEERRDRSFLRGTTQVLAALNNSWCYWPGYRTGDSYSLFVPQGPGQLSPVNASAIELLQLALGASRSRLSAAKDGDIATGILVWRRSIGNPGSAPGQ